MAETTSGVPDHVVTRIVADLREALRNPPPELLDLRATLAFTSQSRASLYRGLAAGSFPRPVSTPSGKRWRRGDLVKWVQHLGKGTRAGRSG